MARQLMEAEVVLRARERIALYLAETPLEAAPGLGAGVWLKLENANKTHSFKVRGALNALLSLDAAARARGVVAASTGNHAQGIAYAAAVIGVRARIVMPVTTAKRKVAGVKQHGGEAILFGDTFDDAEAEARRLEREDGLTYVSPYNDATVIAGAGTVGLAIYDVLPEVERVIVPVGGGGLISGIGLVLKQLKPSVEIVGVNPAVSPEMYNVFYDAHEPTSHDTLADALPGGIEAGSLTRELVRRCVDRIVCVTEAEIADAMRWVIGTQGWLAEGGGVVGVAALRNGSVIADRVTAVVISGGNVDADVVARVLTS